MAVDTESIFTPTTGARMLLEGLYAGRHTRWTLNLRDSLLWIPNAAAKYPWEFRIHAHITDAQFAATVDERLTNQRDAIDRLTKHLKEHCPQLLGQGSCDRMPV